MYNDNGDPFIVTLHNIVLAPDLCEELFYIIKLINLGNTCLFQKGFCTVHFGAKEIYVVTIPQSAQQKHSFWGGIKEMSNTKKSSSRKKFAL